MNQSQHNNVPAQTKRNQLRIREPIIRRNVIKTTALYVVGFIKIDFNRSFIKFNAALIIDDPIFDHRNATIVYYNVFC